VLDTPRLLANLGGNKQLLSDLITLFRRTSGKYRSAIRDALNKGDLIAIRSATHALKGAVGGLWGRASYELLACIEQAARRDDLAGALALAPGIDPTLDALLARLDELQRNQPG
jgi:HPt (histidine-containing phosphotransfer) domain-containing protein